MKKVFKNSELAHVWANQQQEEGRTPNGNLYFINDKIYSYGHHFLIAKFHTNEQGEEAVLFTNRSYSVSTSQHCSYVRQAIPSNNIIPCYNPDGSSHGENFDRWFSKMDLHARSLATARKPEKYLNQIASTFGAVTRYASYFGLAIPANILEISQIENKDQYTTLFAERIELARIEKEKQQKALKKKIAEDLKKWRNFELRRLYSRDGFDYLRFNPEKDRIETSQEVEIPLEVARRFYLHTRTVIAAGGCTNCEQKVLDYNVREINKAFIQVGCHKIAAAEISRLAKQMQWPG